MIDLMKLFGKRYRVTMDESWNAETSENRSEWSKNGEIAWYYEIKGRRGTLYMQKENACALEVTGHTYQNMRKDNPFLFEKIRSASEGCTLLVKEPELDSVVALIRPRRRRVLSPEQRAKNIERLKKYAYRPARRDKPHA